MFNFESLIQKGSEMLCDQLAADCPSVLLKRLGCFFEDKPSLDCRLNEATSQVCYQALQRCPEVWLRQYVLPLAVAGIAIAVAIGLCSHRPRR